MEKKDELSIVMILDKLKEAADFADLGQTVDESYLKEVLAGSKVLLLPML